MYKRKNKHYNKRINTNISPKDNNNPYKNIKPRKYPYGFLFFILESTIKDIYCIITIIILKIYYNFKLDVFSHLDYLLFFCIETLLNGGAFYYLIYSLVKFYDLHSPFNQEWSYIYIWIISSIQLLFFFSSIVLFLLKYIYIKLFFISKFKMLFKILCAVIIIFNILSLIDLKNDKYSFQIQNFEIKKLAKYKQYFKRNYVNLYLSKDYDVDKYELCFDMKYPNNFSEILQNDPPYSLWKFQKKKDYFIGCRNISFKDNPSIDKKNPLSFFKCDVNNKINILPNYCISAENRSKKYNFIYKFNIFQFFLLISFYIYGKFCDYFFKKYFYLSLSKENADETEEKNGDGEEVEEENEGGEEEDDEGEDEEDDEEEEQEDQEEVEENYNWRRNKYRKISKKKMKYYKKKQKNRFRKYQNYNNKNNQKIKEEENEEDNDDKENNCDKLEENNEAENKNNNYADENSNNKNNRKEKNNMKEESQNEKIYDNEDKDKDKESLSPFYKRKSFLYQLILGNIVDKVKNKFYSILKEIDKDIREDEEH